MYRVEVKHLEGWCRENKLLLNVDKTKEIIDFWSSRHEHAPLSISGCTVARVENVRFLGVQISQDLSWNKNTSAGKLMLIKSDGQMNGSVNQADDTKDQVAICLQHDSSDRNPSSDWSDLHHSLVTNSTSHNVELQDMTYPTAFFTAPGTSRALSQRLHSSSSEAEDGGHHSARHDSMDLSRLKHQQRTEALDHQQQQMKIMEWENRMKVLAWEQELVREKRRAAQQKKKAFRMKKAYYKAKLKRMGEEVQLSSSSSSDEEEKTSDLTG
ncbi:uncharacterized protein LOC110961714 isoform X1 [Acanthochromis polyacanthus]|uniref:uncharacterized protein LOC110961714 isoform X1 n=1 Tax=Acanthochromis polyacanthus TaxID=80966 RepID=UPI0022347134|nr:uncharacterized protein LOC110961714 isoform X1 [Acanthochromis polyacanthus]